MRCPYCDSDDIIDVDGEYVCRSCGSVIGPVLYAPRLKIEDVRPLLRRTAASILLASLNDEAKGLGPRVSVEERIRRYIEEVAEALGISEAAKRALELYGAIGKRRVQGKNPRVVAGALLYIAVNEYKLSIDKAAIANRLGVSKLSIRDTATHLKKYVRGGVEYAN
jgi:transcription initiation factor TFIIIB Brf1 subunit/transcription initiation factor TFIIB